MSHIFHITDDITPISGVTGVITQLSRYLTGKGWSTTILAPEGQANLPPSEATLITFPLAAGGVWRFPRGLKLYLQQQALSQAQGLHLHGVWMGFQWLAARVASGTEVPTLLSPHDMLNSWHFGKRGFRELRKLIYWRTVASPAFRHITVIHAGQGMALSVEIGPGLLGQIFDGIQRPLKALQRATGPFIGRGALVAPLDRGKAWTFQPRLKAGDQVAAGDILGAVPETSAMEHRVLAPPGVAGKLTFLAPAGDYTLKDVIARVQDGRGRETELFLWHRWPVRRGRPYRQRLLPTEPLITGQRVLDALFPLAKGGAAAIPGGFGTGKTITQHQLSKWCEADLIVYVGCGERGNEMTGILTELPALQDPRTGHPLMERTILIANTSNMPVAAREASIYTGITHRQLLKEVWGPSYIEQNPYLRIFILNLRRKLEDDPTRPHYLLTEPGVGYRLRVD